MNYGFWTASTSSCKPPTAAATIAGPGRRHGLSAQLRLYCLRNRWITKIRSATINSKEDEVQAKEHLTAHELELLTRKELDHRLARIRGNLRLLLPGRAGLRRRRPPAARAPRRTTGAVVDPQAARKDLRHEPHPASWPRSEILRRYEAGRGVLARGRVLPRRNNQKMEICLP